MTRMSCPSRLRSESTPRTYFASLNTGTATSTRIMKPRLAPRDDPPCQIVPRAFEDHICANEKVKRMRVLAGFARRRRFGECRIGRYIGDGGSGCARG